MNDFGFTPIGWEDYKYWQTENRKILKRVNNLIDDIQRNGPANGIGKPEPLRHRPGWSRRIDDGNRLVYDYVEGKLRILACRGHYDDK